MSLDQMRDAIIKVGLIDWSVSVLFYMKKAEFQDLIVELDCATRSEKISILQSIYTPI